MEPSGGKGYAELLTEFWDLVHEYGKVKKELEFYKTKMTTSRPCTFCKGHKFDEPWWENIEYEGSD